VDTIAAKEAFFGFGTAGARSGEPINQHAPALAVVMLICCFKPANQTQLPPSFAAEVVKRRTLCADAVERDRSRTLFVLMLSPAVSLKSVGKISAEMTTSVEALSGFGTAGIARSESTHLLLFLCSSTSQEEAVKNDNCLQVQLHVPKWWRSRKCFSLLYSSFIYCLLFILQRVSEMSKNWVSSKPASSPSILRDSLIQWIFCEHFRGLLLPIASASCQKDTG